MTASISTIDARSRRTGTGTTTPSVTTACSDRMRECTCAASSAYATGPSARMSAGSCGCRSAADSNQPCRVSVFIGHYSIAGGAITGGTVVSDIFDPTAWEPVDGFDLTDITYHRARDVGAVRIAFDRPEVRNAFRPGTVDELYRALDHARMTSDVGCVLLTGNGPSPKDGGWAFCSGGDQRIRGRDGYKYEGDEGVDPTRLGRLHILEVQRLIRFMPKIVIAVVPGWAVGGGHSLHVVCDLTLASAEHAVFKQTDADVASFDGGYGSALLARQVGQKRAREIFFLGRDHSAAQAHAMGMVNAVVPHADLESTALQWAREITAKSPTAIKMLKYAFNLPDDGLVGQQLFAGEATRLAYGTDEAQEGRDAFLEKRDQDYSSFPWQF